VRAKKSGLLHLPGERPAAAGLVGVEKGIFISSGGALGFPCGALGLC
jgi:hypothetical protein